MSKPPSPRPLSITLIALLFGFTGLQFFGKVGAKTFDILWFTLPEGVVPLFAFTMVALCFYAAIGLWYLKESARRLGIAISSFLLLRQIYFDLMIDWSSKIKESAVIVENAAGQEVAAPLAMAMLFLASISFYMPDILVIFFLIKRKSAFVRPTPPS